MTKPDEDRRKHARSRIHLPLRVKGYETDGEVWEETTASDDVSYGGLSFPLKHHVVRGQVLLLNLALPPELRKFDHGKPTYRIYALVRDVIADPQGSLARLKFLGKRPPRDFEDNPACRYLLAGDPPPEREERRRSARRPVFVGVRLNRMKDEGDRQSEQTVTENLSKGGACLLTTLPIAAGDTVIVEEIGGSYRTEGLVRAVHVGKDGILRLHVRFKEAPPTRLIPHD